MTAPESPAEQPPAESLRERVADALLDADLRRKAEPDAYGQMAAVVIPLVTEDVQRRIAEALDQHGMKHDAYAPIPWGYLSARFVRSLDLSSPALEEQP